MTTFEETDVNKNGVIEREEWRQLELEDRRRKMDDEDAKREPAQNGLVCFVWHGYVPRCSCCLFYRRFRHCAQLLHDIANIYLVSVSALVGAYFGFNAYVMKKMIDTLIGPVAGLLDKFIEDKDQKAKLAHDIATMAERHAHEANMGQLEINKAEAQQRSIFVAGWRPFLVGGLSFAMIWHFVLVPMATFGFAYAGIEAPDLPAFDMDSLMTVLLGMLGLGGLRSFEKTKGLTRVSKLVKQLRRHEGVRTHAYMCSENKITVGVGRNLDENGGIGLSSDEIDYLLENDIKGASKNSSHYRGSLILMTCVKTQW